MASANNFSTSHPQCYHPDSKPPASAFGNIVIIRVVENKHPGKEYRMYRGVLCFYSDRFKQILNGPPQEGSRIYEVNDCGGDKFEMFYNWINTGIASAWAQEVPLVYGSYQRRKSVDLYEFASSYSIPALENYAVDMFYRCSLNTCNIDWQEIWAIYVHTPKNCKMRRVVIDLMIENYLVHIFPPKYNVFPKEFLDDVTEAANIKNLDLSDANAPSSAMDEDWTLDTEAQFCEHYHKHPTSNRKRRADW